MSEERKAIVFGKEEISPEQKASYQTKIAQARSGLNALKTPDPVGGERPTMPDFKKLQEQRDLRHSASGLSEDGGIQPRPPGSPVLRPETEQQLKDMAAAQKTAAEKPKEEAKAEDNKEESLLDLFELAGQTGSEAEKLLNNKKRREDIESRCAPMKFEDLLYKNEVQQKVPILPGQFEPVFRSTTPEESLFIKRYIAKEQAISDQYLWEKYNICLLACALVSINDVMLPDHRLNSGEPDEKLFEAKLKNLLKKSGYIVADLGINYTWFDVRVRKLITADGLKNG